MRHEVTLCRSGIGFDASPDRETRTGLIRRVWTPDGASRLRE